jgi:hypothetical protein
MSGKGALSDFAQFVSMVLGGEVVESFVWSDEDSLMP